MTKIIIQLDNDHEYNETLEEVKRLIEEGCTCGYYPTWKIVKDEE